MPLFYFYIYYQQWAILDQTIDLLFRFFQDVWNYFCPNSTGRLVNNLELIFNIDAYYLCFALLPDYYLTYCLPLLHNYFAVWPLCRFTMIDQNLSFCSLSCFDYFLQLICKILCLYFMMITCIIGELLSHVIHLPYTNNFSSILSQHQAQSLTIH